MPPFGVVLNVNLAESNDPSLSPTTLASLRANCVLPNLNVPNMPVEVLFASKRKTLGVFTVAL